MQTNKKIMKAKEYFFIVFALFTILSTLLTVFSFIGGMVATCVVYIQNMLDPKYERFKDMGADEVFFGTILVAVTLGIISYLLFFITEQFEEEESEEEG